MILLWFSGFITRRINSIRPRQNGCLFADDTFKRIFLNENIRISTKNSPKFVPKGLINNTPALVLIMAWRRPGDKPLSEPMLVRSLTHICVTRPQWVKQKRNYSHVLIISLYLLPILFYWFYLMVVSKILELIHCNNPNITYLLTCQQWMGMSLKSPHVLCLCPLPNLSVCLYGIEIKQYICSSYLVTATDFPKGLEFSTAGNLTKWWNTILPTWKESWDR